MERIRVSKVEDVALWRRGVRFDGTLHLMPHHMVFSYLPPPPAGSSPPAKPPRQKEVWVTYPMISYCVLRPSPPASRQQPSIRIRGRDFTFFAFNFMDEKKARDVYDTIRSLSCKVGRLDKLLAFSYVPKPPEDQLDGWQIYDARREYKRLGISPKDTEKGWRISEINKDYKYSPTYPALLVVPTKISDNVLNYAGNYRSRARIPALVYRHPINNCSITRSSQPSPGIRGNRNPQDERLVAAIWATNSGWKRSQTSTPSNQAGASPDSSVVNLADSSANSSFVGVVDAEAINAGRTTVDDLTDSSEAESDAPRVYGAQQRNMIVDARPTVNAYAMQAVGLGSEKMEYYPNAEKAFLGIDNIHVMRKSLETVVEAIKDSDITSLPPDRRLLAKSGWTKHMSNILMGVRLIAETVGIMHSHVLIHCSDGWDRTSQLSALSQICLDPYYRTLEGFIVLVEKDWLSFGHMFRHRSGYLSSDKWFQIENERIERRSDSPGGSNPFESALRGAKGLFNRQNESSESLPQLSETNGGEMQAVSDAAIPPVDGSVAPASTTVGAAEEHRVTKVNELSPVFHQFLDATYQLMYQYPTRFEFNERFLRRLLYHLYSCQYGTFLFDNEKERMETRAKERTKSVWNYFLCRKEEFLNPLYDPEVDDSVRGKERIVFPERGRPARWWAEVFGRLDEEMNTRVPAFTPQTSSQGQNSHAGGSALGSPANGRSTPVLRSGASTPNPLPMQDRVVTGIETVEGAVGVGASISSRSGSSTSPPDVTVAAAGDADGHADGHLEPPKPAPVSSLPTAVAFGQNLGQNLSQNLAAGMAGLGLGSASGSERGKSPRRSVEKSPVRRAREEMEVEMQ
ncbi:protein-tyrosine phosphatase-like protein [Clohesyomyces aquaticus]|uniref:Protein-tyrosine phosphatase-like protein n=1 Tax=Clohesyomyces aquaticus TaxID=1231657 RepID=A0A1Y1ZR77_9PLEO|nr:protein-tyrosine phosphatase-like protein [Clohesyomyces aquaticus]